MRPAGLEASQGVITAQYLKDATDQQWKASPDMIEWNKFMDKYMPQGDKSSSFHSYGYAVSATMAQVLKQCGDNLTRENVMKQAASLKGFENPMLLTGIKVNTSATDFYPIQAVQLSRFEGESWKVFGNVLANEGASQ
jgi:branched-chain amino acid transport system substrate-binding protein